MPAPLDPDCLFRTLDGHGVDYVLVGGLAAVVHGSSAMTNDADIVPAPDEQNLERLAAALRRVPDGPAVEFDPHPALLGSMAMLNTTTRCGDLDLTFRPTALDDYEQLRTDSHEFDLAGCRVHVAALADIIRSKEAADRPKDRATLPILRALQEEIRRAETQ